MDLTEIIDRAHTITTTRANPTPTRTDLETGLRAITQLQSWLTATKATLTTRLATQVPDPERTITDCTRGSTRDTHLDRTRADTLAASTTLTAALDTNTITTGHLDEISRAARRLEPHQRQHLFDRIDTGLLDIATHLPVDAWRRRLDTEIRNLQHHDGIDRHQQQQRNQRLRTWTDHDGMWCLTARLDPVTGVRIAHQLDTTITALFTHTTPDTTPTDPTERRDHLRALALTTLLDTGNTNNKTGTTNSKTGTTGRADYVVVIDTTTPNGRHEPTIDWGIPVEIPLPVLHQLIGDTTPHPVIVRNGVILHAPGTLDLGRTTRLANRAQRRALRALYPTCAIPGCTTHYNHCQLHHIIWWRHGGHTNLDNLIPVCTHHHTRIHEHHWQLTLGPQRQLTIHYPDGTTHNTGPPTRNAA